MKKFLSIVVALLLMLTGGAIAEELTFEEIFDGTWVQFEEGFEIYLPSEWLELEVTDEMLESGIYYAVTSPDGAYTFQLAWNPLEADITVEELQQELDAAYPGAEILEIEDIALVCIGDVENDILAFAALDAAEPGMYMFCFTPMSDENMQALASVIISSLRHI